MDRIGGARRRRRMLARASARVLEVGIGTARNAERYPAGARVTGVDLSRGMLLRARRRTRPGGVIDGLVQGDAERLSHPDAAFDTVTATCVFCSVADPVAGLREVRRVVKPSGEVLPLEHIRPRNRVLGWLFDVLSPLTRRLFGPRINRRTEQKSWRPGSGSSTSGARGSGARSGPCEATRHRRERPHSPVHARQPVIQRGSRARPSLRARGSRLARSLPAASIRVGHGWHGALAAPSSRHGRTRSQAPQGLVRFPVACGRGPVTGSPDDAPERSRRSRRRPAGGIATIGVAAVAEDDGGEQVPVGRLTRMEQSGEMRDVLERHCQMLQQMQDHASPVMLELSGRGTRQREWMFAGAVTAPSPEVCAMAVPGESRDHVVDVYRHRARRYDLALKPFSLLGYRWRRYRRQAVEALGVQRGDTVVEIGCGTGLNFELIEHAIGLDGRLVGVDLTDAMLAQARHRVRTSGWSNVTLVQADALDFEFPTGLNAIISTYALSLVPECAQVIARGRAALASGGRWVVLDVKIPTNAPRWVQKLGLAAVRPFACTGEWTARRDWEAVRAAMQDNLTDISWTELFFGFTYLAVGARSPGHAPDR